MDQAILRRNDNLVFRLAINIRYYRKETRMILGREYISYRRNWSLCPILADALWEAGCVDEKLMMKLRSGNVIKMGTALAQILAGQTIDSRYCVCGDPLEHNKKLCRSCRRKKYRDLY